MSRGNEPFNFDDLIGPEGLSAQGGEAAVEGVGLPPVAPAGVEAPQPAKPPKPSLRERLRQVDIFTIMLGLAVLAITLAVIFLAIELARYQWDTSARSARQAVQAPQAVVISVVQQV